MKEQINSFTSDPGILKQFGLCGDQLFVIFFTGCCCFMCMNTVIQ